MAKIEVTIDPRGAQLGARVVKRDDMDEIRRKQVELRERAARALGKADRDV